MPSRLIMKRWTHWYRKNDISESKNIWNYYKMTSLYKWDLWLLSVTQIDSYFSYSRLHHHDTNVPPCTAGAEHKSLRNRGDFTDWSLQMVLQKVRYDRPQSITCNLVDYLHIHIDYQAVPSPLILSYHSVVADTELHYWSHPINRDKSARLLPDTTHGGAITQWATYTCNWNKHPSTGTLHSGYLP